MVESKASFKVLYRGFVISVTVYKKSGGQKSVHSQIYHHVPEIKPEQAKRIDKRKIVETQEGEIECMRTHDTIGAVEADSLSTFETYNPPSDEDDENGLIPSWVPVIGGEDNGSNPPATSIMIRDVIEQVQTNIDRYIEQHGLVEVSEEEVMHGLEQTISKPITSVNVSTPEMNTDSSYDTVRPNLDEVSIILERESDSSEL